MNELVSLFKNPLPLYHLKTTNTNHFIFSVYLSASTSYLSCYRYIELNPVRAGIVKKPEDYVYSSYHANALGKPDLMLTPHCEFEAFIEKTAVSANEMYQSQKRLVLILVMLTLVL